MGFEEIITKMENAVDYMDLYDAASYIIDDDLRVAVEQLIEECENDNVSVEEAYSLITSDLLDIHLDELNESLDIDDNTMSYNSIQDYIPDLENASNDKDLLNVLDDMEQNKNLDTDMTTNIRQLFRNNRFMPLNNKVDTLIKYINKEYGQKQESLTEATVIDNDKHTNIEDNKIKSDIVKDTSENVEDDDIDNSTDNSDDILETLNDRVGQQFSVAELNKLLQNVLGQPNKLFLLASDLSSMDLDRTQNIDITDDDITYVISFDIIDMENGIVELTNAKVESGE